MRTIGQELSVSVAAQIARKRPFALVLFRWEVQLFALRESGGWESPE
jgi:hypothetical protein